MKRSIIFLLTSATIILAACTKTKDDEGTKTTPFHGTSIKGIVAFVDNSPAANDTLSVSFSEVGDTIILTTIPRPIGAEEVDISRVTVEIEPDKGATLNPTTPAVFDLTQVREVTMTAEDGTARIYKLKAVIAEPFSVYPKYTATVTQLWSKNGTEMQLVFPGTGKGMTVVGDHLLLLDNTIDKHASAAIRLYDKMTGAFVKNISFYEGGWVDPRSYSWNLETDDYDHMVMGRLNSGGAGFMLDYYSGLEAVPYIMLNSTAGADLPDNTGKRMSVVGNFASGKAYVYATAAHFFGAAKQAPQYAMWEFNNGVPANSRPTVFSYAGAGTGWYNAVVQRASVDDNKLYVSWVNEDGYPSDPFDTWSTLHRINFHVFTPGGAVATQVVNPENFGYRLLDTKVFTLKEGTFMAMLEQSYSTLGSMKLNMFNLTDPGDYSKAPGAADYNSFRIFSSPESPATSNDGRYGHVAVSKISDDEAIVYAYYPNPDASQARVVAYKIEIE